jgi:hypothetical protein
MDVGAIPLSDIIVYWRELYGVFDRLELMERVSLVRVLDNEYLEYVRSKDNGV